MKISFALLLLPFMCNAATAQQYPQPEFVNEVYCLRKDSGHTLVRLEKLLSKLDSRTKGSGFGGYESAYGLDGSKSTARLRANQAVSFVYSNGNSDTTRRSSGGSPSMFDGLDRMNDPTNTVSLYKVESEKDGRKIIMQKLPGANPFGSKKIKSAEKYPFSVKKIRDGYWEFVIDKPLPKGEYAFVITSMGTSDAMTGAATLFAFGVDD